MGAKREKERQAGTAGMVSEVAVASWVAAMAVSKRNDNCDEERFCVISNTYLNHAQPPITATAAVAVGSTQRQPCRHVGATQNSPAATSAAMHAASRATRATARVARAIVMDSNGWMPWDECGWRWLRR